MRAAIIGLPQSGKSTLFTAATGKQIDPADLPQEHFGNVPVPDERVDFLTALYKPKKTTYATIEFVDIPGFSLADKHGIDEFKRHLPTARQAELLIGVIRNFENPAVPPYRQRVDPQADLNELWEEFVYADLEVVTNRIERLEKSLKKPTKTHEAEKREMQLMEKCREALEDTLPLSSVLTSEDDKKALGSFAFLTEKPWVVVYNVDEDRASVEPPEPPKHALSTIALCAETEAEIAQLDETDRPAFLADLGVTEPAQNRLLRLCYKAMGFVTFLTVGDDEVRAWPIRRGASALEAAGKIHSDLARGFIRAETVAYEDLKTAGDMRFAKAAGKVRQEGKGYIVQDGDIIFIKFNL
ncbi:MAG: YchF family ATPase [Phycisphaerae bacterium]|nr:YchF family ATPase [Phycisphaerae bacterium]